MREIINLYFEDENFRDLTLKEAIVQTKDIHVEWFHSDHIDFDIPLNKLMAKKITLWTKQGYDVSEMDINVVIEEFEKYNELYQITIPAKIIKLNQQIDFIMQHQNLLSNPDVPSEITASLNAQVQSVIDDLKQQIKDLS